MCSSCMDGSLTEDRVADGKHLRSTDDIGARLKLRCHEKLRPL